jgi:hypothetical protein
VLLKSKVIVTVVAVQPPSEIEDTSSVPDVDVAVPAPLTKEKFGLFNSSMNVTPLPEPFAPPMASLFASLTSSITISLSVTVPVPQIVGAVPCVIVTCEKTAVTPRNKSPRVKAKKWSKKRPLIIYQCESQRV